MACRCRVAWFISLLFVLGPAVVHAATATGPVRARSSAGVPTVPVIPAIVTDDPPRAVPGEILVRYRPAVRSADRDAIAHARGARPLHRFRFIDLDHLRVEEPVDSALARLRADPRVLYAEPNWIVHAFRTPNDPRFPEQYALDNQGQTGGTPGADISARRAWDVFTGDSTLMVGMIDSGIDYTHPDLAANIWTNPGEIPGNGIDDDGNGYVDDVHGYDFANNDGDPMDDNGHGTHTAGIVAAMGNNGTGGTGVAWRDRLVAIKFLDANGSGSIANAVAAIQYAITVGCRITSNSWGGGALSAALFDAIQAAGSAGQLFVCAAGNSHLDLDTNPVYPASYPSSYILSVAASDDRDSLASFSNFGANSVDIVAPGVNIFSTFPGSRYALISGTSMACPMVAGAASLVLGETPTLGPLEVKGILLGGVDHPTSLAGLTRSGRLNAFNAIATPDSIPPGAITDLTHGEVGSSTVDLSWTATGDDGTIGRASGYDLRWSRNAIVDSASFAAATPIPGAPDPAPAGTVEHFVARGLPFETSLFIALRALDEFDNAGPVSNSVAVTTLGIPHLAVAPHSVSGASLTGVIDSSAVVITNIGAGTLDFTLPTPTVAYAAQPRHDPIRYAKGEAGPQGTVVSGHAGGPDGFGYRWIDSDTTTGPAFDWVDVTAIGTAINLNGDDNISDLIPIGFAFPFYGTQFDSLRVCTNGYLTFTDDFALFANQLLPNLFAPKNGIMPFWDDLVFGAEHRAWVWGDASRLLIEFDGAQHFESGGPYTFEVELRPSGEIRYQYLHLGDPANSATVGIQDGAAQTALEVAFDAPYLHDSLAIKIVPIGQWMTVTPTSGRVLAGQTQPISIRFNPAALAGGDYSGDVRIESNDPDSSVVHVPVHLHVTGAPDLRVSPGTLAFGDVYVGAHPTRSLAVTNPGSDSLRVSAITVSDSTLTTDVTAFQMARFEHRAVTVTWAPTDTGAFSGQVAFQSNDPDLPHLAIAVSGHAIPAPSVSASPESLAAELRTGASTSRTLHVANRGGGDYVFRAVALASPAGVPMAVDREPTPAKGAVDQRPGRAALQGGGPDGFGYTFHDSREPGGPAFQWEDVRAHGTAIALSGDDAVSAPLAFGFDFPFYGESFRSLRVSTNGFVSFTSMSAGFANTPLPSQADGVPENLLAAFWDDLVFPSPGMAWFASDSAHAVVQFQDVPRFGEPGRTNTFEIVIDATGTIEYRYLDLQTRTLTSATVGIQNGTRDDGLLADFDAPYLADSLAVRFIRPPRWVTVTPDTGRIAPGGAEDLAVTFHAAGLAGGGYEGHVELDGNDPLAPRLMIPARLHVLGVPLLDLDPVALDFGTVPIGTSRTLDLGVVNAGSDTLRVDKVLSSDPGFTAAPDHLAIPPFSRRPVEVTFAARARGTFPATLTLRSNDPDTPERTIPINARAAEPPAAAFADTALRFALAHGAGDRALTTLHGVALHNTGGSALIYRAHALTGPSASALAAPLDHEGPKGATAVLVESGARPARPNAAPGTRVGSATSAPGAFGAGGPDSFGYRWIDSDEPGGPAFDWIDATSGQQLPLFGDDETSGPIALPFRFTFYGVPFDSIRVCTNGFASFTSSLSTFTHAPLPNSGAVVPENLLAAFWSDQDFRPTAGSARAFVTGDSARFVIEFEDVPHLTVGGPYTYEIVLGRDGSIDYQYLSMLTRLTEATIGIQNDDRSIGLQVAYNAAYVHDHLRVHFTTAPPWVAVSPDSGALPPGGIDTLKVALSAASSLDGDYEGSLRIEDNEPGVPPHALPVRLHVGLAPASITVENRALAIEPPDHDAHLRVALPGFDARAIDPATVLLNGSQPVHGDSAGSSAAAARLGVPILNLLRSQGGADVIPIELIGESPGVTWFVARDTVRLARPAFTSPAGLKTYGSGGPVPTVPSDDVIDLEWSEAPGVTVAAWDVWLSLDGGDTWVPLASRLGERSLHWLAPAAADSALIEIVGRASSVPVTALISDPFRLAPRDSANGGRPAVFALRLRSANPARDLAFLQLALPRGGAAEVAIYDVTGARVRRLDTSHPSPGFVPLQWDLRDDRGRAVRPGLYFVRASARGSVATLRLAVVR